MFSATKHYLDLCRISNLPTVWTNVLAAVVLSGVSFSWPSYLLLSLSMSLFYSGGMCLNDVCDVESDRSEKPFRPIPSGKITVQTALIFTAVLMIIALSLLLVVPYKKASLAGLLLLAVIIAYDTLHKSYPASICLMAACRFLIFIVSSIAVTGMVGTYVWMAGSFQFAYTLTISIAARLENRKTIPRQSPRFDFSVIPIMIVCISLLDGVVLAMLASPVWLLAGLGGAALAHAGQKYIRGD